MGEITTLECDHCGDVAIESDRHGLFCDGDGDACMTCGYPGSVLVDEPLDDDEPAIARWSVSDDTEAVCNVPSCDECREWRVTLGRPPLAETLQVTEGGGPK